MAVNPKKYEYVLPVGTVLEGGERPYTIESVLGQGGFGITYKVKGTVRVGNLRVEASFAVKEHFMKGRCHRADDGVTVEYSEEAAMDVEDSMKDFIAEGNLLARICKGNPNVVNVNEVFEGNNTAYYVMEYLDGGDLRHLIRDNGGGITEEQAMSIMQPIAQALDYLHQNKQLHMDVKPENIVIRSGIDGNADMPVLIDFGVSLHFDSKGNLTTTHPMIGVSKGYSPIEQHSMVKKFEPTLDVYAFAATWFYLLTGHDPVDAFDITPTYIDNSLPADIKKQTREALKAGLRKEKTERAQSIAAFLKGFEARYTLPVGYVLPSPNTTYRIVSVGKTADNSIQYSARLFSNDSRDGEGDAGATQTFSYTIYECYSKDVFTRGDDEAVVLKKGRQKEELLGGFLEKAKERCGLSQIGESNIDEDLVNCELFEANGTYYVAVKRGYRLPTEKKRVGQDVRKNFWKIGLGVSFVLVAIVLALLLSKRGGSSSQPVPAEVAQTDSAETEIEVVPAEEEEVITSKEDVKEEEKPEADKPVVATPVKCQVCGKVNCTTKHKRCAYCGKWDCTVNHNKCSVCGKDNCNPSKHKKCPTCGKWDCTKTHVKCAVCGKMDCTNPLHKDF